MRNSNLPSYDVNIVEHQKPGRMPVEVVIDVGLRQRRREQLALAQQNARNQYGYSTGRRGNNSDVHMK